MKFLLLPLVLLTTLMGYSQCEFSIHIENGNENVRIESFDTENGVSTLIDSLVGVSFLNSRTIAFDPINQKIVSNGLNHQGQKKIFVIDPTDASVKSFDLPFIPDENIGWAMGFISNNNCILGLENINLEEQSIKISPNPTNSYVKINSSNFEIDNVSILMANGSRIDLPVSSDIIDLTKINTGIYYIQITQMNGISSFHKLIKE